MTIFDWNPIRRHLSEARSRLEFSNLPTTFVPKNYITQRKHSLYNNLFVLLAGLSALTISHDMDIPDTDNGAKLKSILECCCLCISHLVTVPLIISRLHLHYSIVLGAMGMGVVPFFYYIRDPITLSFAICLRVVFVALFDVSAMIYIVKLARMCSRIQGNAVYNEVLTMRSLITIFGCTANIASIAWRKYTLEPEVNFNDKACGTKFCQPGKSMKKVRLSTTLSTGQNTIFIAVSIIIALSGMILLTMYLKPITSLVDWDLSEEPQASNPRCILKQFGKRKTVYLAILITSCAFMYGMVDEFVIAYVICSHSSEYSFFIASMKQTSMIFGVLACVTLIDFMGFRWLYMIALSGQLSSYAYLVFWDSVDFTIEISYLVVHHVLCMCISIETSVVQLLVIQTIGDEEVSAWCFYYFLGDTVHFLRLMSDHYLCTGVKLWILIAISPIAMIAISGYWYRFDNSVTRVSLDEPCSQLIKTSKDTFTKESSFDLKILVENPEGIRTVETLLERKYCLKSRYLVPPPDDVFSDY